MTDQEREDQDVEQKAVPAEEADSSAEAGAEDPDRSAKLGEESADNAGEVSEEELERIMAKFDKDSATRHFGGVPKTVVRYLLAAFTVFMLIINTVYRLPPQIHRAWFVGIIIMFTFMLYPANKKKNIKVNYIPWYDVLLGVVGAACFFYYAINFETIARQAMFFTPMDFYVAVVGIAVLFIAAYRVVGLPLLVVVGAFVGYTWFGQFIPGQFGHRGYRIHRVFTFLFYTTEGVIGTPIAVASTFIFVFMLFGAFLAQTGLGQLFIDIACAIAGKAVGGPAKVSVIASALEATISGSSVANTVSSGSFTIPLMKRLGYDKNFAGGVEAASSTGGQLLPPILGAAAFLMAEITGIPYAQIALAALIPALFYFACMFASVHFESRKKDLKPMSAEQIPKFKDLVGRLHLLMGLITLIYFIAAGYSITTAALYGIAASIVMSMIRKETRLTPKKFIDALETGARNAVGVSIACAMAGLIVGVVVLTGLGLTFANSMVGLAANIHNDSLRLLVILFFCMIASLILGMGVPTTAKYVIMATVTAPVLVHLGVPLIAAHMFVFYFGTDADITPPTGLASYAAAAISRGSPLKTSVVATKLAATAYIIPFIFVFSPQILFYNATARQIALIVPFGVVGIIGIAAGLTGFFVRRMSWWERVLAILAGVCMVDPGYVTKLIGTAVIVGLALLQTIRNRRDPLMRQGA